MKIVKEGKWHLIWTTELACPTCEAVLLVEESDVQPIDYGTGYWCPCPICGKRITISDKLIAQRVREAADKKRRYSSGSAWD